MNFAFLVMTIWSSCWYIIE